ncbi:hypothetical protein EYF80_001370 [Liparis tanakae]|uniref:Uncharacterized protein n=1 Tax=Liparis tanakae TaxID=230148 RepID=A0A4Z2JF40_9TELE|nr:hypothetical protein EYF80_001370 [Liparis tanakae]
MSQAHLFRQPHLRLTTDDNEALKTLGVGTRDAVHAKADERGALTSWLWSCGRAPEGRVKPIKRAHVRMPGHRRMESRSMAQSVH